MAKLTRLQAQAETLTEARNKVQAQLATGAVVVVERILGAKTATARGESGDIAYREAAAQVPQGGEIVARPGETVGGLRTIQEPKTGSLGFGRKPGIYESTVTYVTSPTVIAWAGDPRAKPIVEALKSWYHKSAAGRVGHGICDDCNDTLSPGATYLRPGGYLCCEECTDTLLCAYVDWAEAAKNLNSVVGPGVPADIQRLAMEVWQ